MKHEGEEKASWAKRIDDQLDLRLQIMNIKDND